MCHKVCNRHAKDSHRITLTEGDNRKGCTILLYFVLGKKKKTALLCLLHVLAELSAIYLAANRLATVSRVMLCYIKLG